MTDTYAEVVPEHTYSYASPTSSLTFTGDSPERHYIAEFYGYIDELKERGRLSPDSQQAITLRSDEYDIFLSALALGGAIPKHFASKLVKRIQLGDITIMRERDHFAAED